MYAVLNPNYKKYKRTTLYESYYGIYCLSSAVSLLAMGVGYN